MDLDRSSASDPLPSKLGELERLRVENARLAAAVAEAERRSGLLQAELQHQARNALATVESIVRRTALSSESLDYYVTHLEGRLAAVHRTQKVAALSAGRGGADLDFLLAEELLAHGAREGEQVRLSGPAVQLRGATATALGLAFHELAVNSLKYGALSTQHGRMTVTWAIAPDQGGDDTPRGLFRLDWVESGCRPERDRPRREGFGTELIRRLLAYQLGAEASLNFPADGFHCTIAAPLTQELEASGSGQAAAR